ncbi:MAG: polyphenol oxidase family protein [Elusimicrobia bacterium]|nr:polyphenol oxidase family protein [Elusimicrobiota bacterium]
MTARTMPGGGVARAAGPAAGGAVEPGWRRSGGLLVDERLERLGVLHGATTRALGDMADPARRSTLFDGLGLKGETGLVLKQVHGDAIVRWPSEWDGSGTEKVRADGWMAGAPSRPLCVYTADCVPLLLWGPRFGGVFHVGWRGAAAGFAKKAAESLCRAFGAKASELCASIGPHIGPCCYRVGPEVSSLFRRESLAMGGQVPGGAGGSPLTGGGVAADRLDLGREVASQLVEAGLERGSVAVCGECTCCREDLFFSYRRDKTRDSMMAFLTL